METIYEMRLNLENLYQRFASETVRSRWNAGIERLTVILDKKKNLKWYIFYCKIIY